MIRTIARWRFGVITILAIIVVCAFLLRLIQVQIIKHSYYSSLAEKRGTKREPWPAKRGNVYSRDGVPLAITQKTYALGVTPRDFPKGKEAVRMLAGMIGSDMGSIRRILRKDSKYVPLGRDLHLTKNQITQACSLSGLAIDPGQNRLYPFEALPRQAIGNVSWEGAGGGGVELGFDGHLRGRDGWRLCNIDAKCRAIRQLKAPGKKPVNGRDLVLTIDSRFQSIADFELERALGLYGALGGVVVMLDPHTGDILALAEKTAPGANRESIRAYENALFSVSCIYEPGSTFKLVTAAYLLERGLVSPYDVFYGEGGRARFDFGVFNDDHAFGWLTFKEAFVHSSNICTIKANLNTAPLDFYAFMLDLGLGGKTGIMLPAESSGSLQPPDTWSGRSLASISIGHEIGVTPLQLAMVYCALANGGTLLAPRIAIETRDEKGRAVASFPPLEVRRVFSKKTVQTLTEFCADVVNKGTGVKAAVPGLPVGGKTGTAQKAGPNGYMEGKFIASFAGFAPVEDPKIVCLVLLDEPDWRHHWGGQSAAVVFSRIIEGISVTTDFFFTGDAGRLALQRRETGAVAVPNFLKLTPAQAVRVAARAGLQIHAGSETGVIYSQIPDPGTLVDRGEEVKLILRTAEMTGRQRVSVPDLRGLSVREARRLLLACGLVCRIEGYGIVRGQRPAPGRTVQTGTRITMACRPKIPVPEHGRSDMVKAGAR
jgi:cell division protein FtsI/penicillin-binding protein 2